MANYKLTNAAGRQPPAPSVGDIGAAVARFGSYTFPGTAAGNGDTFDLPVLQRKSTVLEVVVFGPDNISISVGTPSAPTAFINAKTMSAAGLRLSEANGLLYRMTVDEPIRVTYNAAGSSTTGTLRAYVLALPAEA